MNKGAFTIVALLIGGTAAFLFMDGFLDRLADDDSCVAAVAEKASAITFTESGVTPACSIASSGQKITWVNATPRVIQVSSDPHPVHSDNPEISDGKFIIQLDPGQGADAVLTRKGTFGFHDHAKPSLTGTLIIE